MLGAAVVLATAAGVAAQPAGDAKAGEAAFKKLGCYTCHGVWGQGTWRDGPRINPPMPYEAMLQQLRTPRLEMPPYVAGVALRQDASPTSTPICRACRSRSIRT